MISHTTILILSFSINSILNMLPSWLQQMHLMYLTLQKLWSSSSFGVTRCLFYKCDGCFLILALTDPSHTLAQDEITAKLGGCRGNRGGMDKAKTILYQEHHMKPGKHDFFWTGYFQETIPIKRKKEVREPLPFSSAKGDTREYQEMIKDQRLPSDGRWKHQTRTKANSG